MSGPRLLVLGVGDAFAARHYSSCMALEAEGAWLLIDCPHPIRKILREASAQAGLSLDAANLTALVLSHLHADHSSGVEGLGFYYRFRLGRPIALLAHPDVSARLWTGHLAGSMEFSTAQPGEAPVQRGLDDFFDLRALDEASPVQIGPFSIECRRTLHSIPTTAFRIRAAGRCLGCSTDTSFDPGLISWLSAADLIVHECGVGAMHTPYAKLAELPPELRAKMRLIHYSDDFDAAASAIEPLKQGQLLEV